MDIGGIMMKIIIYISFVMVVLISILTFKDWLVVSRKLKRMRIKNIEKLYKVKDMGETFSNILTILFVPFVLDALSTEGIVPVVSVAGTAMVGILVIWINCRLYMYKVKIRDLEKQGDI